MRAWILRELRTEARAWWYHMQLRQGGQFAEAGARERAAIRSDLDILRQTLATEGAHVSTGAGGTTIHYARGRTLSSHGCLAQMAVAQVLVEIGAPFIDTTSVLDPWWLIDLPLVAIGHDPDPPPWSRLSCAPLAAHAARARALGAVVANPPAVTARPAV